uniref:Aspartic peptidase N-terminal domain-containing protein n=1 Tax=Plectus sambesii TaxID=2011161 RepID=A0A914UN47_9BILA
MRFLILVALCLVAAASAQYLTRIPLHKQTTIRASLVDNDSWEQYLKHRQQALTKSFITHSYNRLIGKTKPDSNHEIDEILRNFMDVRICGIVHT